MQEIKRRSSKNNFSKDKLLIIVTIILVIILIVLIALAVKGKGSSKKNAGNEYYVGEDSASGNAGNVFKENSYPEVSSLVNEYFSACADNDFTVLDQIVSDMGEEEKSLITRRSEYVESYNDVVSNTKLGPIDNSYLVFATFNMKFTNVDTAVPGTDS